MMTQVLPELLEVQQAEAAATLSLRIQPELLYFSGHFPQAAVLAGIVQLDWAVHFSRHYLMPQQQVSAVEVLKFQQMIRPDCRIQLVLEWQKAGCTTFSYLDEQQQKLSSGRLKWVAASA